MHPDSLQPHLAIRSLLDELGVVCSEAGCSWTGPQDKLAVHLETCPARLLEASRVRGRRKEALLEQLRDEVARLRSQVEQQTALLQKLTDENQRKDACINNYLSSLNFKAEEVRRKDNRIAALEADLGKLRGNLDHEVAAQLAEQQAVEAAQAAARAREEADAAAQKAALARQTAQESRGHAPAVIQIFVRQIAKGTLVLKVAPYSTVDYVKDLLETKTGIPSSCFYLTYGGKSLAEHHLLMDYNMPDEATLSMLCRLPSRVLGRIGSNLPPTVSTLASSTTAMVRRWRTICPKKRALGDIGVSGFS